MGGRSGRLKAVLVATIVKIGIPSSEPAYAIDGVSMARSIATARVLRVGTQRAWAAAGHRSRSSIRPLQTRRLAAVPRTPVLHQGTPLSSVVDVKAGRRSSPGPSDSPVSVPLIRWFCDGFPAYRATWFRRNSNPKERCLRNQNATTPGIRP